MNTKNTHGGSRPGAGRKRGSTTGRLAQSKSICMRKDEWKLLDEIRGSKSRSKWIVDKLKPKQSIQMNSIFEDADLLVMDGYDDCIVGIVEQFGRPPIACYDKQKVLAKLQNDGMSYDEAYEFWCFNQVDAWLGESTPCFLTINHLEL